MRGKRIVENTRGKGYPNCHGTAGIQERLSRQRDWIETEGKEWCVREQWSQAAGV